MFEIFTNAKAALSRSLFGLLSGFCLMIHAEGSKGKDFLSYTPEEFKKQVEFSAYKPDATKESRSKWLKKSAILYCGTSVSWGNCFTIIIKHDQGIYHLKSRIEAFRQQFLISQDVQLGTAN